MIMNLPAAYHILDLPLGSSLEVVQVRYRKLVKQYHPDRFSNATEKATAEARLKQINAAKEVIQKHWFEAKVKASEPIPAGTPFRDKAASHGSARAGTKAAENTSHKTSGQSSPNTSHKDWAHSASNTRSQSATQTTSKTQTKTAPKTPPQAPPEPPAGEWWQVALQLLVSDLQAWYKKFEKFASLEDGLEQLDKPLKFSSETRLRRIWYTIALIIVVNVLTTGYMENSARRKAVEQGRSPFSVSYLDSVGQYISSQKV